MIEEGRSYQYFEPYYKVESASIIFLPYGAKYMNIEAKEPEFVAIGSESNGNAEFAGKNRASNVKFALQLQISAFKEYVC